MASASDGDIDGFAFDDDVGPMSILLAIAKLVPLGIYLRSGFCKLDLPIVHCDGPLSGIDFFSEGDLERLGYDLRDPLAAGCATGCASGGCATKPRTIDEILTRHRRL